MYHSCTTVCLLVISAHIIIQLESDPEIKIIWIWIHNPAALLGLNRCIIAVTTVFLFAIFAHIIIIQLEPDPNAEIKIIWIRIPNPAALLGLTKVYHSCNTVCLFAISAHKYHHSIRIGSGDENHMDPDPQPCSLIGGK